MSDTKKDIITEQQIQNQLKEKGTVLYSNQKIDSFSTAFIEKENLNLNFTFCTFLGPIYITGQNIVGVFHGSTFEERIEFHNIHFSSEANFHRCRFEKSLSFINVVFNCETTLYRAEFAELEFDHVCFNGQTSFNRAKFNETAYFLYPHFEMTVCFNEIRGNGQLMLNKPNVEKEAETLMKPMAASFEDVHRPGPILLKNANVSETTFSQSDMSVFDFKSVTWNISNNRLLIIRDELKLKEQSKEKLIKDIRKVKQLYVELKRKFIENKDYVLGYASHYGELEMEIRIQKIENKCTILPYSWQRLYKVVSDFGMSWMRPIVWALIAWLLFSLLAVIPEIVEFLTAPSVANFRIFLFKIGSYTEYNLRNTLFFGTKTNVNLYKVFLAGLSKFVTTSLFLISGFAVRRRFRTQ